MKLLLSLIGVVLVLEGLPYAAFPESMIRWLKQLVVLPPRVLRVVGALAIVTGLFLCYLAQRTTMFE